jgi:hypothetical protein
MVYFVAPVSDFSDLLKNENNLDAGRAGRAGSGLGAAFSPRARAAMDSARC